MEKIDSIKRSESTGSKLNKALIPDYIVQKLGLGNRDLSQLNLPCSYTEAAGILFTDICSFTDITQKLSATGHYGVEDIIEILNDYFAAMHDCIYSNGGSLIKYGGDSIFAVFPGTPAEAVPRMQRCKQEMVQALQKLNIRFKQQYGFCIEFDGAIKYGQINLRVVGDIAYHLDYYIDGLAVQELFELGGQALEAELLPGAETLDYLNAQYIPAPLPQLESKIKGKSFIPATVSRKVRERSFKAELRNSAVIFIHLNSKDRSKLIKVEDYQSIYTQIQRHVYNLDGTINKIDFNDKGYLILITFGTPYNHTDDVERAFICAYRIRNIPSDTVLMKLGVTYSNIFAGILGAPRRHEYGIIGNAVNIAARLMANSAEGEISFSQEILPHVNSRFESVFIEETFVKGISKALRIHKLIRELPDSWYAMLSKYQDRHLTCYHDEVRQILEHLSKHKSCFVELQGEAGTGKSFVAYHILQRLRQQNDEITIFVMEEFDSRKQCVWLCKVFSQKLMIYDAHQEFDLLKNYAIQQGIRFDAALLKRYFKAISTATEQPSKEEIELISATLAEIVWHLFAGSSLLFIDDIQWMDESSRRVLELLIPRLLQSGSSIMLARRGQAEAHPLSHQADHYLRVKLQNLDQAQAYTLIQQEIPIISKDALHNIFTLTKGNPLFIVEMAKVIRKNVDVQSSILAESDLKRLEKDGIISDTIENLLLNEYQNLDEESQRTLKVASIIGKAFALEDLSIVSEEGFKQEIDNIVNELSDTQIIGKKSFDPGIEYVFKNQLMRDAIYRTILLSEKSELHEKIASYYENKYEDKLSVYLELIANHYIYAQNPQKALQYSLAAGEKTARLAAYPVSNYYYEKALSFCNDPASCYQIKLAMIKNCVNQGDAPSGLLLIDELAQEHKELLDGDFHLQKVRLYILQGLNREVAEYVPKIYPSLTDDFFKASISLRYMDALQFLNRMEEFEAQAGRLRELLKSQTDHKLQGDYLTTMAMMYNMRSDYAKATEYYNQLRQLSEQSGEPIHRRIALHGLGIVASRTGDKKQARKHYEEALQICEKIGDRNGYSKIIMDLGTLHRNEGEIEKALQMYQISLQTTRLVGNVNLEGTVLYNIGEANYYLERYDEARKYFEDTLKIYEQSGDLVGRSFCYDALGDINYRQDRFTEAKAIYDMNLILQKELKDTEGIAHTLGNLGNVAKADKDFALAREYYDQQISMLSEVGDKDGLGRAYFNYAMTEKDESNLPAAKEKLSKALQLFQDCQAQIFIDIAQQQMQEIDQGLKSGQ
jgi:class 3 adenylate cyclase